MEKDLYETLKKKDNMVANPGLQIIKHPSYGKQLLSWFDIRVFYVRISNLMVDGYTPEYLTLNHIPLDPDTVLEVNGRRCTLHSEGSSCCLRRNRVDKKFEEATFVSTDNIRLSGSVKFEVFDGEYFILSGALEISNDCNGNVGELKDNDIGKWSMSCESLISASNRFLKGKQMVVCDSAPPMIEVYVAGSFSGTPIILTKTLQISLRKKQNRNGRLDSIPEYETAESRKDVASGLDLQEYQSLEQNYSKEYLRGLGLQKYQPHPACDLVDIDYLAKIAEYRHYKPVNDENYDNSLYWSQTEYMEGEDGALSWFNAGVRVGVGIGLGVCLGVGIGVGLLVRTYQSTTRTFRRRL